VVLRNSFENENRKPYLYSNMYRIQKEMWINFAKLKEHQHINFETTQGTGHIRFSSRFCSTRYEWWAGLRPGIDSLFLPFLLPSSRLWQEGFDWRLIDPFMSHSETFLNACIIQNLLNSSLVDCTTRFFDGHWGKKLPLKKFQPKHNFCWRRD
jgi:hypothetical protein